MFNLDVWKILEANNYPRHLQRNLNNKAVLVVVMDAWGYSLEPDFFMAAAFFLRNA